MNALTDHILDKIKTDHITPKPRWEFLVHDYIVWGLFGLSLLLGAISLSIILYITSANQDAYLTLNNNPLAVVVYTIPIVWIILMGCLCFVTYYNYKHTPRGYKVGWWKVISVNLLFIIVSGIFLQQVGFGESVHESLARIAPQYAAITDPRYQVWMRPTEGYLVGDIISIDLEAKTFRLTDLYQNNWTINYQSAEIKPAVQLTVGQRIKLIGSTDGNSSFLAKEIRPWSGKNRNLQENYSHLRIN